MAPHDAAEGQRLSSRIGGSFDGLAFERFQRRPPGPTEVEVQIYAAALNWKDVLTVLGLLPSSADAPKTFGAECAGVVSAVGHDVSTVQVGDSVVAVGTSCLGSHVLVEQSAVAPIPAGLSFASATTIPVAFTTAYHALHDIARLSRGERILIHSAAGGVGLAAVQLGKWLGAELYATAGRREKREFLLSLGVRKAWDSRSDEFVQSIKDATRGQGVDVVLNSLSGEFIDHGLATLAPYGRFVELGIRDILAGNTLNLRPFEKSLSFSAVRLTPQHPNFPRIFSAVLKLHAQSELQPLSYHLFASDEVQVAFAHMANPARIGKIVIGFSKDAEAVPTLPLVRKMRPAVDSAWSVNTHQLDPSLRGYNFDTSDYLKNEEGLDVFRLVLEGNLSRVIVSTSPLDERIRRSARLLGQRALLETQGQKGVQSPRGNLATLYVAPRDDIERQIAETWQALLGIESIGMCDDFFALGGDSVLIVQLISKTRSAFNVHVPAQTLLQNPTIEELARFIRKSQSTPSDKASHSHVMPLNAAGALRRMFLIHPVGGLVYIYRDLAHKLERQISVYGVQARGLDGEAEPMDTVSALAALYIDEIRTVQPDGPYLLGGASFGGIVAYEMARMLNAVGQHVERVMMLDSAGPGHHPSRSMDVPDILAYLLKVGANQPAAAAEVRRLDNEQQLDYFFGQTGIADQILAGLTRTQIGNFLRVWQACARAAASYSPSASPVPILFFRATEQDGFNSPTPERGWLDVAEGGLELVEVPGNHITMNYQPNVEAIAHRILASLVTSQQDRSARGSSRNSRG